MEPHAAAALAESLYGLHVRRATSLQPTSFDWREIMRLDTTDQGVWLLRMLRLPEAAASYAQTAALLLWLEGAGYPAPRVRPTVAGQLVGSAGAWATLCVSFVAGATPTLTTTNFMALGATLGRLHALPADHAAFAPAQCHPDELQAAIEQLAQAAAHAPEAVRPMLAALHSDMQRLLPALDALALTHGDCWYQNAITTPDGTAVLIDWDGAGLGAPLLDLGYLLLTSHYDLAQPLVVVPDPARIAAIMRGYRMHAALPPAASELLRPAVRFALALHFASYLQDTSPSDFNGPVLHKLQARFDVSAAIALAAQRWC